MDFLTNRYKNNSVYKNLYADNTLDKEEDKYIPEKEFEEEQHKKTQELKKKIELTKKNVKNNILESEITAEPFFDSEFLKHLENLNNFFSSYIPNFPKYYENGKVNPRAFLDAKDLLQNELPMSVDEILYTPTTTNGVTNPDKMHFENGYSIDFDGNVYDPNRNIVFNSNLVGEKVKYLDLLNNKVITDKGLRLELPESFLDNFLKDIKLTWNDIKENNLKYEKDIDNKFNPNDYYNPKTIADRVKEFREKAEKYPKDIENLINYEDVFGHYKGHPISIEEKYLIELPVENLFLTDIFSDIDKLNFAEEIKQFYSEEAELGVCNFKDIPYGELSSLLLWGGGEKGVKPLSNQAIEDKDIIFTKDGTAKYTGVNSTITTKRNGCKERTYQTGHLCMWTSRNRLGLKRSIIQYLYAFCAGIGLFNANIPRLLGFKKIRVFSGLCIGGLLERVLCAWQQRISKRINDLFACKPAQIMTDLNKSGFENATFPHGSSVDDITQLDSITSCKFGDRYVVNKVPTSISKTSEIACGVFFFDPNQKLKQYCPWTYNKVWSGKPFNEKDNFQIVKEYNNIYSNPIIQDLLANKNTLGEDSITRRLMALQFAFMKKQILLESQEIQSSLESIIENTIYDSLQNITQDLARFDSIYSKFNNDEFKSSNPGQRGNYYREFFDYFGQLTLYGFKIPPTKKIAYTETTPLVDRNKGVKNINYDFKNYNKSKQTNIEVETYDLNLDRNEYIIPTPENIVYYDALLFAYRNVPTNRIKEIFKKNIEYLSKTEPETSKKYMRVRTVRDYLNTFNKFEDFDSQVRSTLDFVSYDLNINNYSEASFKQLMERINSFIDDVPII